MSSDHSSEERDSSDDEDEQVDYFKKIQITNLHERLTEIHHEQQFCTHEETIQKTQITRDEFGIICDEHHQTLPFLTKFERARILGIRTQQLNSGHEAMVSRNGVSDGYQVALTEYKAKKIPFIIKRPLPNGKSEYWRFADLEQLT